MDLFDTFDHDSYFELPREGERDIESIARGSWCNREFRQLT